MNRAQEVLSNMNGNRVRGIAAAVALAIGSMGATQAQSSPAPDQNQKPVTAQEPQAASRPTALESKRKGGSDGIKVNGYWTIEVKNPDGTVASHTEFENSIQNKGMLALAGLLAGTSASGGLAIMLDGATALISSEVALGNHGIATLKVQNTSQTPCGLCIIAPSSSFIALGSGVATSTGLSVSGPTLTSLPGADIVNGFQGAAQVTLQGSITAIAGGTINDVETLLISCFPTITAQACVTGTNSENGGLFDVLVSLFTEKPLDGIGGDPSAVSVTQGQVIGITVTLTFQ